MDYVKNAWYVAGWGSEFGQDPRRVTILEEHLVMYRTSTGRVVALEDRCPHRLLPHGLALDPNKDRFVINPSRQVVAGDELLAHRDPSCADPDRRYAHAQERPPTSPTPWYDG